MKFIVPSIFVFAACIGSLALGNVLLKMGTHRMGELTAAGLPAWRAFLKTPELPIGALLMVVQFAGTMVLFSWGWDASVVIPTLGLCYVVIAFLGKWLLHEPVGPLRWVGILFIIVGVFFVARSAATTKLP